ncbi:MAG: COX15/CtaA family protein [FCB group bacterium]|jgi:cytochrome c oxidase assembly protein subunit 15|nr:COX15/CtaA family protein [FCB group bacterium]
MSTTVPAAALRPHPWLRRFTKFVVLSTLALIFIGGLVTSHGAGLAVPDWPTTYGENMFTYPLEKWQGGILYEHGHRLFASFVGMLIIVLTFWQFVDKRSVVRGLGFVALALVILQGVLGGVSVLMRLQWATPEPIWFATLVLHGVLAQSFLALTVVLAYLQSKEYAARIGEPEAPADHALAPWAIAVAALVSLQLIIAAAMRHRGAGLALMDFPTSGGYLIPTFSDAMLANVNEMRRAYAAQMGIDFMEVTMGQVLIHFAHRFMAFVITIAVATLAVKTLRRAGASRRLVRGVLLLAGFVVVQFCLGVAAFWMHKEPVVTSIHVVVGAATLATSVLVVLRALPVRARRQAVKSLRNAALDTAKA